MFRFVFSRACLMPRVRNLGLALLVATVMLPAVAQPASAATPVSADVALNVLVLDDGSPMVEAIADRLTSEGQPFTRLDLNASSRPQITDAFLVTLNASGAHAKFSGVVAPNEAPSQLTSDERTMLADYETAFRVRQVSAYTWAHPEVGLNYAANPGYVGAVDGLRASVTPEGAAGAFAYLNGVTLDDISPNVSESWGYLATPVATTATSSFTPLLTATIPGSDVQGSLIGAYENNGREQLIVTFASNKSQNHWKTISHGVVTWLTRGISLTYNRNFFSVHIDDILLPDALWSEEGNCTIGDGCDPVAYPETAPGATSRMTTTDVQRLLNWQSSSGIKLDMVFNGGGAAEQKAETGSDALEAALLANSAQLRWINHTWSHPYLGCVQDFTKTPWACAKTTTDAIQYASRTTIYNEIAQNQQYAATNNLPNYRSNVLVTGEHSGLKSAPQMSVDNPNLASALKLTGIQWVASDASRESTVRTIGSAKTVPRYPMNIYYNTETKSQAVDEYNWIYTSAADGGSGACEKLTDVMTCIAPLDKVTGFDSYIVPVESRIALAHLLGNDPRPHYAHQANLAADGVLYPVLDKVLATYRTDFADIAPLLNPTMEDAGAELVRQANWKAATSRLTGTVSGSSVTIKNTSASSLTAPVTMPSGTRQGSTTFGTSYAGQNSAWVSFGAGQSRAYSMRGSSGYATTVVWPVPSPVSGGVPNPVVEAQSPTTVLPLNQAESKVVEAVKPGS